MSGCWAARQAGRAPLKVHVDFGVCESNGICMGVDPEVFELGDDDNLTVLMPEVGPERAPLVREAVRQCPRQAITFDESS